MNHIRLLPIVTIAVAALFLVKSLGLFAANDYPINPITPAVAQDTPADAAEPVAAAPADGDDSAAAEGATGDTASGDAADEIDGSDFNGRAVDAESTGNSQSIILQRLGERREALEKRSAELDLREQLLNATELRVERRVAELKALEERIQAENKERQDYEDTRLKGLVQMYENMKPKDAARVFDRLNLEILVDVVRQMKPRKMSAILAKMSPETAERLTVALATNRTDQDGGENEQTDLPKIEGKPTQ